MLSRVLVLCMAGGAAAAAAPSCGGGACGGAEEVDEVQLLQTVVRVHGPVELEDLAVDDPGRSAAELEKYFPKTMSYITKEMNQILAHSLPTKEVMEVLQDLLANTQASSFAGSSDETEDHSDEMDDRALRLFKGLDRLAASKPAKQLALQGQGHVARVKISNYDDPNGHTDSVDQGIADCTQPPKDGGCCAWYAVCLETDRKCGKDGYPLGFANATCIAVDDGLAGPQSTAGRAWWRATTLCLQKSLVADMAVTACDKLWDNAFKYQKACFSSKETCALEPIDAWYAQVALVTAEVRPQVFKHAEATYDQLSKVFLKC